MKTFFLATLLKAANTTNGNVVINTPDRRSMELSSSIEPTDEELAALVASGFDFSGLEISTSCPTDLTCNRVTSSKDSRCIEVVEIGGWRGCVVWRKETAGCVKRWWYVQ